MAIDRRAIPDDALESRWCARDGRALRRIDFPAGGRGSLLFLPGRADCYEKYLESFGAWAHRGWRVTALDWRDQAGSGRGGLDPLTGHIDDFAIWVEDLADFWSQWVATRPAPHVLVAHSMGGHLALRAVAERRLRPDALVLSTPMLGMVAFGLPERLLRAVARLMVALGDPRRPAWPHAERPGARAADRMALLTHDAARYADEAWWRAQRPELAMGSPSWGWVSAALASIHALERPGLLEAVREPVLLIGTRRDRLVRFAAIRAAAGRLPRAELLTLGPEAAHEVLREVDPVRDRVLAAIDRFLDRTAPACPA
ncbi:MAG: alpha/beta hydrolase [Sphingomonadales bacterium]|nr:alpha/beta hydrolase [Sphingomonadales bacterium]